jgi:diketogulonate reductase-like aldo/keto reductase
VGRTDGRSHPLDATQRRIMTEQGTGAIGGPVCELDGGVLMPRLGLGVWQLKEGPETEQAVEWALEIGYRHVDTATFYRNERSVGVALRRSGVPREQVFVTTKWLPILRNPDVELARSLKRLGLEYVDLYLIHWPLPGRMSRGWREFEAIQERGLARAIGVSNFGSDRLARLLRVASRPPAVNQVHFSPLHFRPKILADCARQGIVVEAYSPLEHGRAFGNPTVVEIAQRLERTEAQVLLRWAIQHDAVVIPKSARRDRIRENAQIFDFEISPDDMRRLDALDVKRSLVRERHRGA